MPSPQNLLVVNFKEAVAIVKSYGFFVVLIFLGFLTSALKFEFLPVPGGASQLRFVSFLIYEKSKQVSAERKILDWQNRIRIFRISQINILAPVPVGFSWEKFLLCWCAFAPRKLV